jgi:hypothetical protein
LALQSLRELEIVLDFANEDTAGHQNKGRGRVDFLRACGNVPRPAGRQDRVVACSAAIGAWMASA